MCIYFYRRIVPEEKITCEDCQYYKLIKNIRNGVSLTKNDHIYISGLPIKNLIEIITIYDMLVDIYIER